MRAVALLAVSTVSTVAQLTAEYIRSRRAQGTSSSVIICRKAESASERSRSVRGSAAGSSCGLDVDPGASTSSDWQR